jgi:RNA 2',3'-cyclic 3'-phosphodiesterase
MRLFIGIDLPPQIKQSLFKSQLRLKRLGVQGHWKVPEYFHITIEFLGEIPAESLPTLIEIMNDVLRDKKRFKLQIDKPGTFPSFHGGHIVWAGIRGDRKKLDEVWSELHEGLVKKGFTLKKAPFIPHITILTSPGKPVEDLDMFLLRKTGYFTITEIILFESKIEDAKRTYLQLHHVCLKR